MEPNPELTKNVIEPGLIQAIESQDVDTVLVTLQRASHEKTPTAEVLEALGLRLQIRDFLRNQKAGIAAVAGRTEAFETGLTGFFSAMDTELSGITDYGHTEDEHFNETLKPARIGRLRQAIERDHTKAFAFMSNFFEQPKADMMTPGQLTERIITVRQGIVETLWPVAISEREQADHEMLIHELESASSTANNRIDTMMRGVVDWRS